ncbi:hypothetical protein ACFPOE_02360 [Caenimonas terrae]|uniref:Porin n=1 Tax=Caenimonas terrae TaxID=696074 RepID=A0ABW0N8P0_9BURK
MSPSKRASRLTLQLLTLAVALPLATPASAADELQRIEQLERKLAQSLALIEQLSARLNQVEKAAPSAAAADPASVTAAQSERIDRLEQTLVKVSESSAKSRDLGVPLHGFADVGYVRSSQALDGRRSGFALGNFDLYITPEIGDRVKSIVELVFEYGPDSANVATDLERLQFGYTFSDAATVWAGRFHTPYGYWNTAFHHGQQIQTAATRPRFIEFEDRGGILPAHAVGLLVSGGVKAGAGRVGYDGYLANGNRVVDGVLDFNAFRDDNGNKMVGGNLRYSFGGRLDGLTLGLHGFTQQVAQYDGQNAVVNNTKVNMTGAYAVYEHADWEVIAEYYRFRNRDLSGGSGTHASWAGFGQLGYTLAGKWTPYARLEKAALDQADNYFASQDSGRSYSRSTLGLRYDLNPSTAIKMELNQTRQQQRDASTLRANETRLQLAVRF